MSLNYPDRAKWLTVRRTPTKPRRGRFVHVSTRYGWVPNDKDWPDGPRSFVKVLKGVTYRRPT